MDGEPVGNFTVSGMGGPATYIYNALFYAGTSLPSGTHSFLLQNGQGDGTGPQSLVLFDYLMYTM